MPNDELLRLAERVEKLAGPDREVDLRIEAAINPDYNGMDDEQARFLTKYGGHPAYTASLDAAMQLVPNQSEWGLYSPDTDAGESKFCCEISPAAAAWKAGRSAQASYAATPALALTAAALRARAHSGDTQ